MRLINYAMSWSNGEKKFHITTVGPKTWLIFGQNVNNEAVKWRSRLLHKKCKKHLSNKERMEKECDFYTIHG